MYHSGRSAEAAAGGHPPLGHGTLLAASSSKIVSQLVSGIVTSRFSSRPVFSVSSHLPSCVPAGYPVRIGSL
jgi:hypothetical protein